MLHKCMQKKAQHFPAVRPTAPRVPHAKLASRISLQPKVYTINNGAVACYREAKPLGSSIASKTTTRVSKTTN